MNRVRLDQLRVRQLNFLNLLASEGSLAAVAEKLSMTPSAASMMLKEIEGIFNTKLFLRQGRGMAMTEAGRALLPRCQTVLGEVSAMTSAIQGEGKPLLRIGAFPHTTTTVLPGIVRTLVAGQPSWHVQLIDRSADQLTQMLMQSEIDLLIGRLPAVVASSQLTDELEQQVLYDIRLCVVAARNHPLARKKKLTMAALRDWPWILPGIKSTTRVSLVDAFLKRGLPPPTPHVESPSFFYSLSIVAQSDMLTCCAQSAASQYNGRTTILPIEIGQEAAPVSVIWRKKSVEARRAVRQIAETLGWLKR